MKRIGLALLLAASAAQADPRVTEHFFHAGEVVTLHGRTGLQSTVGFGEGERIENVAIGDSAAWEVVPNKRADLLFVKPLKPRAHTNMTVVTDRHTYLFDLVAAPTGPEVYMLTFTYPAPPPPTLEALAAAAPTSPPPAPAAPPQAAEVSPADLNFAWTSKGAKALLPARAFDDGHQVYLEWRKAASLPAILVRGAGGQEGPVNYTVKDGTIVVEGVPGQIILRSGKQMATLTPEPRGSEAPQQTARRAPPPSIPEASSVPTPVRFPAPEGQP